MNISVKKCVICNNKNSGSFFVINDKKYHSYCVEHLEHNWNELKKWLEEQKENFQFAGDFGEFNTNIEDLEIVLNKIKELEEGGNND